ncbi:hypothetical protein M231_05626 [Tremella mesenterica]|uniref:Ubiquitin-like protease family profile domain-containing protein n=1 Tax=Tremella mesenterica TaxID=5217 RepID=A0A4Q1BHN7_TREME|nr:hypothetical protein M231_05626 [Tremella mesenterica]
MEAYVALLVDWSRLHGVALKPVDPGFVSLLLMGGRSTLRAMQWSDSWTDLFTCAGLLIPVHVSNSHWMAAFVSMSCRAVCIYDSLADEGEVIRIGEASLISSPRFLHLPWFSIMPLSTPSSPWVSDVFVQPVDLSL